MSAAIINNVAAATAAHKAGYGPVVQLVRTLACHARGRQFEPDPGRHYASVAQSVEQGTENPRVIGSIPIGGTSQGNPAGFPICGRSSSGRAPPCQGGGSEFEPRRPLQHEAIVDAEMQRRWLFCVSFCTELPKTPFCRRTEPSDCKNCAFPLAKRPGMRYSIATV